MIKNIFTYLFTALLIFLYLGILPTWINGTFYSNGKEYELLERTAILGISFIGFLIFGITNRKRIQLLRNSKIFTYGLIGSITIISLLWLSNWLFGLVETTSTILGILTIIIILGFTFGLNLFILILDDKYKIISLTKFIITIFLLNIFSWFLWGRGNTIMLVPEHTSNFDFYYYNQVFIETENSNIPFYWNTYNDYSRNEQNNFKSKFSKSIFNCKLRIIKNHKAISDSLNIGKNPFFYFGIIRDIPFLCFIEYGTIAGMGSKSYKTYYIWFFHWYQVKDELTGIS